MSKKTIISAAGLALGIAAGSAFAGPVYGDHSTYTIFQDGINATITAADIDGGVNNTESVGVIYSNIPGPYSAFGASSGSLGVDDYVSTSTDAGDTLASYRFVGGPASDSSGGFGVMFFDFFDAGGTFVDGFGVGFGQFGNFIYTITITDPTSISIPNAGFHEVSTSSDTTAQWFLNNIGASVGSTVLGHDSSADFDGTFEMDVIPAPASIALLGLGAFAATRRRRA